MLPVDTLSEWMEEDGPSPAPAPAPEANTEHSTWRERLWSVPAETRMTAAEVAEALGKSRSWVYGHAKAPTGNKDEVVLPFRKLGHDTLFLAGEIREWIETSEVVMSNSLAARRKLHALG